MQKKASVEESNKTLVVVLVITGIILILGLLVGYLLHNYYSDNDGSGVVVNETKVTQPVVNETPTVTNQTPLTTNQTANQTTTATGGSGGGTTTPTCTDTCSSLGFECGNWSVCGSVVDCGICGSGFECISGECVELVNCTSDIDCGYLSGVCGIGLCNLSLNECYTSYNLTTDVCRESGFECDAAEYCSGGGVDCPADVNESEGTICSRGSCSGGVCQVISANTFYVSVTGSGSHDGSLGNEMNLSDAQAYANAHTDEEITFLLEGGEYGAFVENNIIHPNWITYKAKEGKTPIFKSIRFYSNTGHLDSKLKFVGIKVYHGGAYIRNVNQVHFYNSTFIGNGYHPYPYNRSDYAIYLHTASNVVIENVNITGDGLGFDSYVGHLSVPLGEIGGIQGSEGGYGKGFSFGVLFDAPCINVTINNSNIGSTNIAISAASKQGILINKNYIHHVTSDFITLGSTNPGDSDLFDPTVISNNHLYGGMEIYLGDDTYDELTTDNFAHTDGIQGGGFYTETYHDEINHLIIKNNTIHHSDGAAMFIRGAMKAPYNNTYWVIENNLVYDTMLRNQQGSETSTYTINLQNCKDATFRKNTVIGRVEASRDSTSSSPMTFTDFSNNLFYKCGLNTISPYNTSLLQEEKNIINTVVYGMAGHVWDETTSILNNESIFTNIFVDYDNSDYHPLINSPACNGSINPVGVAVGALPCVCTQDSQCVEVFGSGSVCNLQTQKCEGGLGTQSFHKSSFFSVIWQWVKSLFS